MENKSSVPNLRIVLAFFVLVQVALSIVGVLDFKIWSQVGELEYMPSSQISVFDVPHHLRFLLIYTLVFLPSKIMGISSDLMMNVTVNVVLFLCYSLAVKFYISIFIAIKGLSTSLAPLLWPLIPCSFILLASFMNGRLVFNFLGQITIVYSLFLFVSRKTPFGGYLHLVCCILVGLLFSSVSSGTFVVAFATVVITTALVSMTGMLNPIKRQFSLLLAVSLSLLCFPLIKMYLFKNLDYYGGGGEAFINMLNHGFGKVFLSYLSPLILSISIVLLLAIPLALVIFVKFPLYFPIGANILASSLLGVYGWSTLLSMLPVLSVLGLLVAEGIVPMEIKSRLERQWTGSGFFINETLMPDCKGSK